MSDSEQNDANDGQSRLTVGLGNGAKCQHPRFRAWGSDRFGWCHCTTCGKVFGLDEAFNLIMDRVERKFGF